MYEPRQRCDLKSRSGDVISNMYFEYKIFNCIYISCHKVVSVYHINSTHDRNLLVNCSTGCLSQLNFSCLYTSVYIKCNLYVFERYKPSIMRFKEMKSSVSRSSNMT